MSQPRTEFHFMETMLQQIEKTEASEKENLPDAEGASIEEARKEIEFKLQMGQSPVWASILQLDDFLIKATA
jgi:hypothetical protein